MGLLEDRDTCESLGGIQVILGATWAPLRTEALVNALAVFTSFRAQHGLPEDRDTCESLGGFHFIPGATWAS